jgi:prevent-host-death family protein
MTITVPISELKQRTGKILSRVVLERQVVIVERYGEEIAVIISRERYQELVDVAQARVRERFLEAQKEVYSATDEIPVDEIEELVESVTKESRRERAT